MKKVLLTTVAVFLTAFFISGCMQNIPWEQRWANDYCNTIDWAAEDIEPTSTSNLCMLAEKYQVTLREAQGIVFWLAALGSITDENAIITIGQYTDKVEVYLQTPSLSLATLFGMVIDDSKDPRWAMLANLINYSVFTYWGKDPIADYALTAKDMWFLRAHLNNVRKMIGYQIPAENL